MVGVEMKPNRQNSFLKKLIKFQLILLIASPSRGSIDTAATTNSGGSSGGSSAGHHPQNKCKIDYNLKTLTCQLITKNHEILINSTNNNLNNLILNFYNSSWSNPKLMTIKKIHLKCLSSSTSAMNFDFENLINFKNNQLNDLIIENCEISSLRNFQNFERIKVFQAVIRDFKSWTAATNVPQRMGKSRLREFDLSFNKIKNFPHGFFCLLSSDLRHLNLTYNHIGNIQSISGECRLTTETIDLSWNEIEILRDNDFVSFESLRYLFLRSNKIHEISSNSFNGLIKIEVIDLSHNRITSLPRYAFQQVRGLKKLLLQSNGIQEIKFDTFNEFIRLDILDLSRNKIVEVVSVLDSKIISLNLGFNLLRLVNLSSTTPLLENLNLEQNHIATDNLVISCQSLKVLLLTGNKLKVVSFSLFRGVPNLEQIFLESNHIEIVEPETFVHLSRLYDLSLNDNKLESVPSALNELKTNIRSLDLGNNQISLIDSTNFYEMSELLGLRLTGNRISLIDKNSFVKLKKLQVLNLASNRLVHFERHTFKPLQSLQALRLDGNQITDISNAFLSHLNSLVWLNISDNQITEFSFSHTPIHLEWLEIHQNNLTRLNLQHENHLTYIDASSNQLASLNDLTLPGSIKTIVLRSNNIHDISNGFFTAKLSLEKLDLRENHIKRLNFPALSLPKSMRRNINLFLSGNPVHCDCQMEWLQKINKIEGYPTIKDLNEMQCTMEMARGDILRNISELSPQNFLCEYTTHCFALCHCCDFDACDCKMTCPDGCQCYYDHIWSTNVVNCGNTYYTHVPDRIPMDATIIFLDGNNFGELGNHLFIGKKRLEGLYVNNSNIHNLANRTFFGLSKLKYLNVAHNQIHHIYAIMFDTLNDLEEVYLDHNHITSIESSSFAIIPALKFVSLNYNKFKAIDFVITITKTRPRFEIFEGNTLECDCGIFDGDVVVVRPPHTKVSCLNWSNYKSFEEYCSRGGGGGTHRGGDNVLITSDRDQIEFNGLVGGEYLTIVAAILIGIITTILIVILLCFCHKKFNLFLYTKYGIRLYKNPLGPGRRKRHRGDGGALTTDDDYDEQNKFLDAHLIYSELDINFITNILGNEIKNLGYKINNNSSKNYDEIFLEKSLNGAKRLIIFITMNFLENWKMNKKFYNSIKKLIDDSKSYRVILIISAPLELIITDLYLNNLAHSSFIIFLGEKRFWDKLKYAMPDLNPEDQKNARRHHKKVRKKYFGSNLEVGGSIGGVVGSGAGVGGGGADGVDDDKQNNEYPSYVTFSETENQYSTSGRTKKAKNHFYSTIGEVSSNGRAYFV